MQTAFFSLTFVCRETGEEKGQQLVQLQSLAGAQAKPAQGFHAGNGLLTKICLLLTVIPSSLHFQEQKAGKEQKGDRGAGLESSLILF